MKRACSPVKIEQTQFHQTPAVCGVWQNIRPQRVLQLCKRKKWVTLITQYERFVNCFKRWFYSGKIMV
jgi:hypothetical protein